MDSSTGQTATTVSEPNPPIVNAERPAPYGIPRRFGLGAMLMVTTVFAGLFALMRAIGFDIVVLMATIIYLLSIALAQMCFRNGLARRRLSQAPFCFP